MIEVSNIVDESWLGTEVTLSALGKLLKAPHENPHATLVGLFLNAIDEVTESNGPSAWSQTEWKRLQCYLPLTRTLFKGPHRYSAGDAKYVGAFNYLRDFDELFNAYVAKYDLRNVSRDYGLMMKPRNTILAPWPMALPQDASQADFDLLYASGHAAHARYVEWKRVDLDQEVFRPAIINHASWEGFRR